MRLSYLTKKWVTDEARRSLYKVSIGIWFIPKILALLYTPHLEWCLIQIYINWSTALLSPMETWALVSNRGGSINPDTNIVLHRHFNSGIHFISNPISWLHPIQWWSKSSQEVAVAVCNPTVFGNDRMLNMFDIYCMVLLLPTTIRAAETISAQNSRNLSTAGAECRCPSINEKDHLAGKLGEGFPKKSSCSFGLFFVQMRGGGPAQNFCPLFTNCILGQFGDGDGEGETPHWANTGSWSNFVWITL